jgi:hypothetical protein
LHSECQESKKEQKEDDKDDRSVASEESMIIGEVFGQPNELFENPEEKTKEKDTGPSEPCSKFCYTIVHLLVLRNVK